MALLHPGHIVGPGWVPVNPAGNLELSVFERLVTGQELALPNLGMETLHHVHADDVAQAFALAIERPDDGGGRIVPCDIRACDHAPGLRGGYR